MPGLDAGGAAADLVLFLLLALYLLFGYLNGFIDGLVRLATLAVAVLGFTHGAPYVIEALGLDLGVSEDAVHATLGILILVLVFMAGRLLRVGAAVLRDVPLNRFLGLGMGFARFCVMAVGLVLVSWVVPRNLTGDLWEDSIALPFLGQLAGRVVWEAYEGDVRVEPGLAVIDAGAGIQISMPREYYPRRSLLEDVASDEGEDGGAGAAESLLEDARTIGEKIDETNRLIDSLNERDGDVDEDVIETEATKAPVKGRARPADEP